LDTDQVLSRDMRPLLAITDRLATNQPSLRASPPDPDEINRLIDSYFDAWQTGDVKTLAGLLDDSFKHFEPGRDPLNKSQFVFWKEHFAQALKRRHSRDAIKIIPGNREVKIEGSEAMVSFNQFYLSPCYASRGKKEWIIKRSTDGMVRIFREAFIGKEVKLQSRAKWCARTPRGT
jgi:hypothetical protein